jgi:hypothetical protein
VIVVLVPTTSAANQLSVYRLPQRRRSLVVAATATEAERATTATTLRLREFVPIGETVTSGGSRRVTAVGARMGDPRQKAHPRHDLGGFDPERPCYQSCYRTERIRQNRGDLTP